MKNIDEERIKNELIKIITSKIPKSQVTCQETLNDFLHFISDKIIKDINKALIYNISNLSTSIILSLQEGKLVESNYDIIKYCINLSGVIFPNIYHDSERKPSKETNSLLLKMLWEELKKIDKTSYNELLKMQTIYPPEKLINLLIQKITFLGKNNPKDTEMWERLAKLGNKASTDAELLKRFNALKKYLKYKKKYLKLKKSYIKK
jgi:hypothetical protein